MVGDRPGQVFRYAVDASKVERLLGWTQRIMFEAGLKPDRNLVHAEPGMVGETTVDSRDSNQYHGWQERATLAPINPTKDAERRT